MNFMDIINVPLGLILKGIYWIIGDYGWSILVFALLARIIMLPSAIKTQKNQLKMQKLQPKIKQLNNKYHNNTRDPKYQQEMQDLYAKEGYNPLSGCLPMLIQMPVIFGLWNVIRQPLTYICNFSESNLYNAVKVAVESGVQNESIQKLIEVFGKVITDGKLAEWGKEVKDLIKLNEIYIADMINSNGTLDNLMEAIEQKAVVNTEFLGINLGESASAHGLWSPFILVPIIAAELLHTDYGAMGVFMILMFFITRGIEDKVLLQSVGLLGLGFSVFKTSVIQPFAILAMIPISLYSGKKTSHSKVLQLGFYLFYPVHLLILWLIKEMPFV